MVHSTVCSGNHKFHVFSDDRLILVLVMYLLWCYFFPKLLYLGREYPKGTAYFRERLKAAFMKNRDETDPEKIRKLIDKGEFVIKELEAMYYLRKYRAMKKRYYEPEH